MVLEGGGCSFRRLSAKATPSRRTCVCMCVCACVRVYACLCMYGFYSLCACVCACVCVRACVYVCVCMCMCVCVCARTCACVCVFVLCVCGFPADNQTTSPLFLSAHLHVMPSPSVRSQSYTTSSQMTCPISCIPLPHTCTRLYTQKMPTAPPAACSSSS